MLVLGDTEQSVTEVLIASTGKATPTPGGCSTQAYAYGEMYGVEPGPLAEGLASENPALARLLEEAASSIKIGTEDATNTSECPRH